MFQGGHGEASPLDVYHKARHHVPVRPVLEGECAYEGIHAFTADDVRNRAWRAVMAGCFGYTYGSHGLWYPTQNEEDTHAKEWGTPTPWWIALDRPGAEHLGVMRGILERAAWQQLEPLPEAIVAQNTSAAGSHAAKIVADLAARFESAKPANALWCKRFTHEWAATDLVDIGLHPKMGKPATLSWPAIQLPKIDHGEAIRLVVALGMSSKANLNDPKHPSDGVTYLVIVNGKKLLAEHRKSKRWAYHCLDLTKFAGQKITVVLSVDAGKNSAWDHALFRAPVILRASTANRTPMKEAYTAALAEPVQAKGDRQNVFLVYFPQLQAQERLGVSLRGLAKGKTYTAQWLDCRTGAEHAADPIRTNNGQAPLPKPPDSKDWVLLLRLRR